MQTLRSTLVVAFSLRDELTPRPLILADGLKLNFSIFMNPFDVSFEKGLYSRKTAYI